MNTITVPKQTWDALREALERFSELEVGTMNGNFRSCCARRRNESHSEKCSIYKLLTAANAVSDMGNPITEPTVPDNSQEWKGMDGAIAFHLIERHADGWTDVGKMMGEWLAANAVIAQSSDPAALSSEVKPLSSEPQAPYANCRFRICDLPGQCKGEGKCHHPAVPQAQGLTPESARAMVAEMDMNDRVLAAIDAEPQAQGEAVYLVATGETHNGEETYCRYDYPPGLSEFERLYTHPQATEPAPKQAEPRSECSWCETCQPLTLGNMRMIVCPECGNKRCPKATHHNNLCINSNDIGQKGSSWEHVKPAAPEAKQ